MSTLLITQAIPLTQIAYAAASITASYTLAGSFTKPVMVMNIVSTLDQPVQISFDGTNDHVAVPAGSAEPVSIQFNFADNRVIFAAPVNVFVKRIGAPGSGNLYISAFSNTQP